MLRKTLYFVLILLICLPLTATAALFTFSDEFSDSTYTDNWTNLFPSEATWVEGSDVITGTPINQTHHDTAALQYDGGTFLNNNLDLIIDLKYDSTAPNNKEFGGLAFGLTDSGAYLAGIDVFSSTLFIDDSETSGLPLASSIAFTGLNVTSFFTLDLAIEDGDAHLELWQNGNELASISYGLGAIASQSGSVGFFSDGIATFDNFDMRSGTAPVPEPSTIFLLGGGLAGLAFYRRKRK